VEREPGGASGTRAFLTGKDKPRKEKSWRGSELIRLEGQGKRYSKKTLSEEKRKEVKK